MVIIVKLQLREICPNLVFIIIILCCLQYLLSVIIKCLSFKPLTSLKQLKDVLQYCIVVELRGFPSAVDNGQFASPASNVDDKINILDMFLFCRRRSWGGVIRRRRGGGCVIRLEPLCGQCHSEVLVLVTPGLARPRFASTVPAST